MKKTFLSLFLICCTASMTQAQSKYTLQQLKDSALRNNIAIRTARHNIESARQQRKEAFTKYFPGISGTGVWFNANRSTGKAEFNPSELLPNTLAQTLAQILPAEALAALNSPIGISMMKNGTIAGITALQPVFMGGQIVNGNKLAKIGEEVAALQLQLSENEVEKQTEQYFWQLVTLKEKTKTIATIDTLLASISKDVTIAIRAGIALPNDLLQVQLRQNEIESQRLKLQNGISIVRLLMTQFCGLRDTTFTLAHNVDEETKAQTSLFPKAPLTESDKQRSLQLLPEHQLLNKQVEFADLQRKIAVGKRMPSVAVGAGYNYHNILDNDRTFGMVFATVAIPVSDWWGGSHAIKRKRVARQIAEEQLNDSDELLKIQMQNAYNSVIEAQQQLDISQRGIEQAKENLRLNRNYYKSGVANMSDLLEAQHLYQQACDRHVEAYANYQNKLLEYRQATGQ